jgi:hypothetical protein
MAAGTDRGAPSTGAGAAASGIDVEDGRAEGRDGRDDDDEDDDDDGRGGRDEAAGASDDGPPRSGPRIGTQPPGAPTTSRHPVCGTLSLWDVRYSIVMALSE